MSFAQVLKELIDSKNEQISLGAVKEAIKGLNPEKQEHGLHYTVL